MSKIYGRPVATPINPEKLVPSGVVKTVNGTPPDENGNVDVAGGGDSNVVVVTYDNTTMKASMTGTEIYAAIKSGKTVVLNDGHFQKFMQFVDGSSARAVVCSTGLVPVVKGSVWSGTFEVMSEATDILFVDADGNVIKKNSSVTVPTPTYLDDNKVLVAVGDYYGSTKWVDPSTLPGGGGKDGVSATHEWNGTVLTITSASGTSSADLKGDKGDTGAQGPKGDTGSQGIQGIQGIQGEPGAKGDKGDPGADGAKGDKGDPGEKGEQGEQGPKGDKGDQGIQGEKGETGETGAKGDKGDKGDPGTNGTDGKTPVKGTDYWTDADKTEMVNDVLAALPIWIGGSY